MSTAIDMPQADARLPRATATANMPQAAIQVLEAADDEVKPWWAYVVEFLVIPIYCMLSRVWPTWIWDRQGVRDQELAQLDLDIYWNQTIRDAMDELAYPIVRVPDDLEGLYDRTLWRLRSWDWWTVKSWYAVLVIKRLMQFGPTMAPPLGVDPYNQHSHK